MNFSNFARYIFAYRWLAIFSVVAIVPIYVAKAYIYSSNYNNIIGHSKKTSQQDKNKTVVKDKEIEVRLIMIPNEKLPNGPIGSIVPTNSGNFGTSVALLLITAAITGIAVPKVKSKMDMRFFQEQKIHEAVLARQASLINAQTEFLRSYADYLWQLHFAMLKVSYAKVTVEDDAEFNKIWTCYQDIAWQALQSHRRLLSSSVNLVSSEFFSTLIVFYEKVLRNEAILSNNIQQNRYVNWRDYHNNLIYEESSQLDRQIISLAIEMKLSK